MSQTALEMVDTNRPSPSPSASASASPSPKSIKIVLYTPTPFGVFSNLILGCAKIHTSGMGKGYTLVGWGEGGKGGRGEGEREGGHSEKMHSFPPRSECNVFNLNARIFNGRI